MRDVPFRHLRIAIASTGRFHVLDLARELRAIGHDVKFYAHVPRRRAESFGLAREVVVPLTATAAPYLAWKRYFPRLTPALARRLYFRALNRAVIRRLAPCDVFIAMSGVYLEAAEHARKAFGAKIFLERGSMHVDAQQKILQDFQTLGPETLLTREREVAGYAMADRIVVPSFHAAESFNGERSIADKVVIIPYGVDLNMFPVSSLTTGRGRRVLYVGNWTFQKGVDLLTTAVMKIEAAELLHVGSQGNMPFPERAGFIHCDAVDQSALSAFYQRADVFVLASRQDGFGMVLLQALASGLPCVVSDHTGGPTIHRVWPEIAPLVRIVPAGNANALSEGIAEMLAERPQPISPEARARLSWAAYGARYEAALLDAVKAVGR